MMGSATGPPAVLMSVTVWELRSQCASCTLLLLFLREIGQEDEGRTERQERRGLCRKRRSSGDEKKGKRRWKKEEEGRWQISLMESELLVSCSCLRLCLRLYSFSFSCVCTMSGLSHGCQIFQDCLLRCALLWLIHKEAMQMDDVAALREMNLVTVSETNTVPGNKELTRSPASCTGESSTNSTKREIQYYPKPRHKSTHHTALFLSSVCLMPSFPAASLSFHLPV